MSYTIVDEGKTGGVAVAWIIVTRTLGHTLASNATSRV